MRPRAFLIFGVLMIALGAPVSAIAALPIAMPERTEPVRFQSEVLPFVAANCVACHNANKQEGGLSLETVEAIVAGGDSGPAVIAGKPDESVLLVRAAHRDADADPMPPQGNSVGGRNLAPEELGLLARWIAEGAVAGPAATAGPIEWRPVPPGTGPVVALDMTLDGRLTAAARGNRVSLFDTVSGEETGRLVDGGISPADQGRGLAHRDPLGAVAFAPAGDRLATGSFRTIKLWRRESPPIATLAETAAATALAVSADGTRAALGLPDGGIVVVDPTSASILGRFAVHDAAVTALSFATDGSTLFSLASSGGLAATTVADGSTTGRLARPAGTTAIAAIDDRRLATAEPDHVVRIWPLPLPAPADAGAAEPPFGPKPLKELADSRQPIAALAVVPTMAGHLVAGGSDGMARLWNADAGSVVRAFDHGGAITALAVRSDGSRLATAGSIPGIKLWNPADGTIVAEPRGDVRLARRLAAADLGLAVDRQDFELAKSRVTAAEKDITGAAEEKKKTAEAVVSAEKMLGEKTEALASARRAVEFAEARDLKAQEDLRRRTTEMEAVENRLARATEARTALEQETTASARPVAAVAFSADGGRLAALDAEGRLAILGSADGGIRDLFDAARPAGGAGGAIAFSGDRLVVAGAGTDATTWDLTERWMLERTIGGESTPPTADDDPGGPPVGLVTALAFSPDGTLLASGGGRASRSGETKLWNVENGMLTRSLAAPHSDTVMALAFSRQGDLLASGAADRLVRVHAVADGSHVRSFKGHTGHVLGVAWQAHGRRIASAGADNTVKIWDMATGEQERTITGPKKEVTGVRFVGATDELLAATGDPLVRVYNVRNGSVVREFRNAGDFVQALASGPTLVAAGGQDGRVRLWNLADAKPLHTVEAAPAGR